MSTSTPMGFTFVPRNYIGLDMALRSRINGRLRREPVRCLEPSDVDSRIGRMRTCLTGERWPAWRSL
jgi:hypothetical protein